jgi:hypothetical protein
MLSRFQHFLKEKGKLSELKKRGDNWVFFFVNVSSIQTHLCFVNYCFFLWIFTIVGINSSGSNIGGWYTLYGNKEHANKVDG